MKKIWKGIVVAGIAATLVVPAMAQQAGPTGGGLQGGQTGAKHGGQGGGKMLKIGQEVLAKVQPPLSKDQEKQISALKKKTMASMKELRDKAQTGDKSKLREDMKKIFEDHRKAMMAILTPDQQKSYEALMKEAMAKAKADGGAKKGGKVNPPL